jgi:hypothetical protein
VERAEEIAAISRFTCKLAAQEKNTEPRFSRDKVIAIARKAAIEYPNGKDLNSVSLEENAGVLLWIVSSISVGCTLFVRIDDASGDVIEIKQLGVR